MAEETHENVTDVGGDEGEAIEEESKTSDKTTSRGRLGRWRWMVVLLSVSVLNFGIGFVCSQFLTHRAPTTVGREFDLGEFRFQAGKEAADSIAQAEFTLHVGLLEQIGQAARGQLQARAYRVRQDVEELLRQAHGGDFDDPNLGGLKRQLQEQINETLGMRAIADVIITDLQLKHGEATAATAVETAESVPWVEKPSDLAAADEKRSGQ